MITLFEFSFNSGGATIQEKQFFHKGDQTMIKTLLGQIGAYKKASLTAPLLTVLEVFFEVLIPYITASIIDKGISAGNLEKVYSYGAMILVLAFCSLLAGAWSGKFSAVASGRPGLQSARRHV